MDNITVLRRSENMRRIRSKNTMPEIMVRKGLHARGYRYKLHVNDLPGKPDLVFPKYSAVIFINGCFWHGHNCHLFRLPKSNVDFWENKISRNKELDEQHLNQLAAMGWRVGIVWECSLKGKTKIVFESLLDAIESWLKQSDDSELSLSGIET